ncbi:hypothetical protein AUP74_01195 [Microbulbifer aggregans]|uniref:Spore coat protein U domain-containing protein n=1 Tax=Microbulbifer aggregans TaxID=1769779 RepID=A0A1C9W6A7_9GAMM|nr:hypothetical protein [Microbulbifer aggregans]AOS96657.1 hypothetical protein AUP74_01195 [Microbulbifer aggregans]
MTRIWFLLCCFVLLQVSTPVSGESDNDENCSVISLSLEGAAGLIYYPFADRDGINPLRLSIDARGRCLFGVALLPASGAHLRGPGQPLNLSFRDRGDRVIPMNGSEQRWLQFEPAARGYTLDLVVKLPVGQARRIGDYDNTFVLRVFANGQWVRDIDFRLSARVAPQADLQLAGNAQSQLGRSAGMNFGELEEGETLSAMLAVRANGAYNLAVASENNGQLQHVSLKGENTAVPYRAWLDGQQLSLQGGKDSRSFSAPENGRRLRNISVQIGDTKGRMAGQYRDTLRVTVTLLE